MTWNCFYFKYPGLSIGLIGYLVDSRISRGTCNLIRTPRIIKIIKKDKTLKGCVIDERIAYTESVLFSISKVYATKVFTFHFPCFSCVHRL